MAGIFISHAHSDQPINLIGALLGNKIRVNSWMVWEAGAALTKFVGVDQRLEGRVRQQMDSAP